MADNGDYLHHLPAPWRRIDRWVVSATQMAVCFVGTTFTVLVTLEVISRYIFNFSIFLVNSAAGFLLVWFFMLGAGLAFRDGAHVGLELIVARIPERLSRLTWLVAQGLVLLFSVIMCWSGYRTLGSAYYQVEGALGISLAWVMLAFPVGFLLVIYHQITIVVATMMRAEPR